MTRCFDSPCHDVAVTTKLLMKSAERSTKWCNSNDEETGDNAVQRLNMLPNTAEQKAYVTPAAIYGAWFTQRIKKERKPGFAQLNEACCAMQRPPPSPRGCVPPPLGGATVLRRLWWRRTNVFFLNAAKRLEMVSSAVERTTAVMQTAISRCSAYTAHFKSHQRLAVCTHVTRH
jgi:hypothetical protein